MATDTEPGSKMNDAVEVISSDKPCMKMIPFSVAIPEGLDYLDPDGAPKRRLGGGLGELWWASGRSWATQEPQNSPKTTKRPQNGPQLEPKSPYRTTALRKKLLRIIHPTALVRLAEIAVGLSGSAHRLSGRFGGAAPLEIRPLSLLKAQRRPWSEANCW